MIKTHMGSTIDRNDISKCVKTASTRRCDAVAGSYFVFERSQVRILAVSRIDYSDRSVSCFTKSLEGNAGLNFRFSRRRYEV
jgi:hypothetical protein